MLQKTEKLNRNTESSWGKKKKDIRAESSRKFNKIPQKTIVDSEKLQNYKIH